MYVRNGPAVWQEQCDPTRTKQSEFQHRFPPVRRRGGALYCKWTPAGSGALTRQSRHFSDLAPGSCYAGSRCPPGAEGQRQDPGISPNGHPGGQWRPGEVRRAGRCILEMRPAGSRGPLAEIPAPSSPPLAWRAIRNADARRKRSADTAIPPLLSPAMLECRLFRAIWFTFFLTDGRSVSHTHSLANRDADVNRNP